MYKNKTILITGGTGSWGEALTKRLLKEGIKEIRILSRNEFVQVEMQRKFNNIKLRYIIGDIRDIDSLNFAMKNVDYVFHLAALKHVPICEAHPKEAILTNINGTENVIKAAINNNVLKVIYVSTDKAVSPHNLYGMTKAIGEKLIIHANTFTDKTEFVCMRSGNLIGSNGSVIPLFIEQIKDNNQITITDREMTRYFLSEDEAIELLIEAGEKSNRGEILVVNMPLCKIIDLAEVLIEIYGNKDTQIKEIGIRDGEKLHEDIISEYEVPNTYVICNNYYLIKPQIEINNSNRDYSKYKKCDFEMINTQQVLMDKEQIRRMIKE